MFISGNSDTSGCYLTWNDLHLGISLLSLMFIDISNKMTEHHNKFNMLFYKFLV